MPYDISLLVGTYDPQHVAIEGDGENPASATFSGAYPPGFTHNTDGTYTISSLPNVVANLPGYGAFSDKNQTAPDNPTEGDLVDFRVIDYNQTTGTINYFYDVENAQLNGVDTQGPFGATIVGYEQVGSTQNFLLEDIAGYLPANQPGTYTGRPGISFFILSGKDALNNLDPETFQPLSQNAFFASGSHTFQPTGFLPECFASGTRIAIPGGERFVEDLKAGNSVLTAEGAEATIIWVGQRRINFAHHPAACALHPVLIEAGAFADTIPARPLRLSPDHAVFLDGVLIPIKHLINGTSIRQIAVDHVTYHHVELETHSLLLAEGLAAESYLNVGAQNAFEGGPVIAAHPDFSQHRWEAEGCAPLVVAGPVVERARARLARRARKSARAKAA